MDRVVELIGFPCSGKTSLCRMHECQNLIHYSDALVFYRRIINSVVMILVNPKIFIFSICTFFSTPLKYWYYQAIGIVRFFSRMHEIKNINQSSNLIIEEGVAQGFWGLFMLVKPNKYSYCLAESIYECVAKYIFDIRYLRVSRSELKDRNVKRQKRTRFLLLINKKDMVGVNSSRFWMAYLLVKLREDQKVLSSTSKC